MSEMIGRVAEALAKSRGVVIVDEVDYRQFAADARAAIAAMREPTEAMLQAGERQGDGYYNAGPWATWQAMIAAALAGMDGEAT
jgi:hypothetical protein